MMVLVNNARHTERSRSVISIANFKPLLSLERIVKPGIDNYFPWVGNSKRSNSYAANTK